MKLKLGAFIPPLILLAFIGCAIIFGGTMYKNYEIDQVMRASDRKFICLVQSYNVKHADGNNYYVDFGDNRKFFFPGFSPTAKAGYIVLVIDAANRTIWTTVDRKRWEYIHDVYNVPYDECRQ